MYGAPLPSVKLKSVTKGLIWTISRPVDKEHMRYYHTLIRKRLSDYLLMERGWRMPTGRADILMIAKW